MNLFNVLFGRHRNKLASDSESTHAPKQVDSIAPSARHAQVGCSSPSPEETMDIQSSKGTDELHPPSQSRSLAPACPNAVISYFDAVIAVAARTDHNFYIEYKRLLETVDYTRHAYSIAIADYAAAAANACGTDIICDSAEHADMLQASRAYIAAKSAEHAAYAEAVGAKAATGTSSPSATKAYATAKNALAEATKDYIASSKAFLATGICGDQPVTRHILAVGKFLAALEVYVASRTAKEKAGAVGEDPSVTAASVALAEARDFRNSMIPPEAKRSPPGIR